MQLKRLLFLYLGLTLTITVHAQRSTDSALKDSTTLSEALLLKDQQQKRIDSLVKIQLQQELRSAAGNVKRTQELEQKLQQLAINDSLRLIGQQQKLKQLQKNAVGYPVVLNKDTLFQIFTRTGSFDARERAKAISKKVEQLYLDPFFKTDSLVIAANEGNYDIVYKQSEIIISIGNLDGLWFGKSNEQLAQEYLQIINKHIQSERESHSLTNLIKRILMVATIIAVLIVVVWLLNRLFRISARFIILNREKYLETFRLKKLKIIKADHLEAALLKLNTLIKVVLMIVIIYLSLPLLFSIFPETEDWTGTLLNWILEPLRSAGKAFIDYLPDLFKVLIIFLLFKYLIRAIRYFFYEINRGNIQFRGFHAEWAIPTFNILRFLLYAFMLVVMFPFLPGSGSPAFQGVSVFLGVLISLGSSSAISNIVAGLVITYMRPFRVGDRVKIGEVVGDIMEKTMLVTRVKTIKNEAITVPNAMVLSSSTINYSNYTKNDGPGLIVHYTVTVGYDVPWQQVYELLTAAALQTLHILEEPKPFVLQTKLDDFNISYQINAYTKQANLQAAIYSNLLEHIQDTFSAAGIELVSPSFHVLREEGKS